MTASVLRPDGCDIPLPQGGVSHGVDQDWYPSYWRRKAGCGPCTASNMLRYWRDELTLPVQTHSQEQMTALMAKAWDYVTPGVFGLNSPHRFQQGMDELLAHLGSGMRCRVLEVPREAGARPDAAQVADFLRAGFEQDSPVAFLNLHNGGLHHLEGWHWVTLLGMSFAQGQLTAQAIDNGDRLTLDLGAWLRATQLGGGFVYCAHGQETTRMGKEPPT